MADQWPAYIRDLIESATPLIQHVEPDPLPEEYVIGESLETYCQRLEGKVAALKQLSTALSAKHKQARFEADHWRELCGGFSEDLRAERKRTQDWTDAAICLGILFICSALWHLVRWVGGGA